MPKSFRKYSPVAIGRYLSIGIAQGISLSYSHNELIKTAAKGSSIDTDHSFPQLKVSISEKIYKLFKDQPGLSANSLRKTFPLKAYNQRLEDSKT